MANTKLLDAVDGYGTKVTLLERVVSDWQRELRLTVSGLTLEQNLRAGATHHKNVTIKKPAELADLALKLKEFLTSPGIAVMKLTLKPHNRLAGSLWRDTESSVWDLNRSHGGRQGIRIDDALLTELMQIAESYE